MTAGLKNLQTELTTRLAASPTGLACCQLTNALAILNTTVVSVANLAALPSAVNNKGRLVFVTDIGAYRYSDGVYWVSDVNSTLGNNALLLAWGTYCGCVPTLIEGRNWCNISGRAAIKTDGTAWTWGGNTFGALGDGTVITRFSPGTLSGGGTNWCQISSNNNQTAAVKTDGTAWTWGYNLNGGLGDGTVVNKSSPVTVAGGGTTWCQISTGGRHMAAITTSGCAWTWGRGSEGQLGNNSTTSRSSPVQVAGAISTWCQISAGNNFTAAVRTNGVLMTWGDPNQGRLGDNSSNFRSSPGAVSGGGYTWCQVSAGGDRAAAVKTDGTAWTWGRNQYGQLGDGTVICRSSPITPAGGGTNWRQISAGGAHTAAVKTDGTAWTWGRNSLGNLGDGTVTNRSSPGTTSCTANAWCAVSVYGYITTGIQLSPKGFK